MVTAISAIIVFGFIVLFHELGHFVTAKMTGMRVDEFAIGFGPKIFGYKRGETEYSIRIVPLGGYNKIAGMTKEEDEDPEAEYPPAYERAYYQRPIWARMIVILAGSFMNLITPVFLILGVCLFFGADKPNSEPVVGMVIEHKPAAEAGLLAGDRVLAIDGKPISDWRQISENLADGAGVAHDIKIDRSGEEMNFAITPVVDNGRVILGIFGTVEHYQPGVLESIEVAVSYNLHMVEMMIVSLYHLVVGAASTADLAGPIGVIEMTGKVAERGIIPLLNFAAIISLNLGIVNLLPIPVLDGGHFATLCVEAVRGKPLGPKANNIVQNFGAAILISIMLFATFNDITR